MTAIIENIIPKSNFEIVLNQLGVILLTELSKQNELQCFNEDFAIYLDRQEPYSISEGLMINVSLSEVNFSGKTQLGAQGATTYFIDVFNQGVETQCETGSDNSRVKSLKFLSMIRYILASTKYNTLGFDKGFIGGTSVDGIQNQLSYGNQESNFTKFARITFSARLNENQLAWDSVDFYGNDTNIKIDNTDLGYKLIFNS